MKNKLLSISLSLSLSLAGRLLQCSPSLHKTSTVAATVSRSTAHTLVEGLQKIHSLPYQLMVEGSREGIWCLSQYCTPSAPVSVSWRDSLIHLASFGGGERKRERGQKERERGQKEREREGSGVFDNPDFMVENCRSVLICAQQPSHMCQVSLAISAWHILYLSLSLSLSLSQPEQYEWLVHLSALALDWLRTYHNVLKQVEEEIPSSRNSSPHDDSDNPSPDVTQCETDFSSLPPPPSLSSHN